MLCCDHEEVRPDIVVLGKVRYHNDGEDEDDYIEKYVSDILRGRFGLTVVGLHDHQRVIQLLSDILREFLINNKNKIKYLKNIPPPPYTYTHTEGWLIETIIIRMI